MLQSFLQYFLIGMAKEHFGEKNGGIRILSSDPNSTRRFTTLKGILFKEHTPEIVLVTSDKGHP